MSAVAKTEDDEERNEFGYPLYAAKVSGGERSPLTTNIDQSINKALPWVAFSWLLSGGALVGLIVLALLVPQIIDSKVAAGVADAKAVMAQQVADAKAAANTSRVDARVALDKVEDFRTKLAEKGIKIPPLDGH